MPGFIRPGLFVLLCASALAAGGCTKTSDGSYEFRNAPRFSLFSRSDELSSRNGGIALTEYRRGRHTSTSWELRRKEAETLNWRPAHRRPMTAGLASTAAASLSCRNVTGAGGRVRVVCR